MVLTEMADERARRSGMCGLVDEEKEWQRHDDDSTKFSQTY